MNVLSASSAETFGTLNTAPELLDAVKCGGETFISYASGEDVAEIRKVAREAVKNPITSGLLLGDADFVSVVVAGPRDMSIKALNAAIAIVQPRVVSQRGVVDIFRPERRFRESESTACQHLGRDARSRGERWI